MPADVVRWQFGSDVGPLRATLARGGVLALPTESSYALGADPRDHRAVESVFRIKRRRADQPLPVVVPSLDLLQGLGVELPAGGLLGFERAWPGALSVLLPCPRDMPAAAGSGRLAIRIPGHAGLHSLLAELGLALTATSANRSGEDPVLEPEHLQTLLVGEDAMIVDGGRLPGGPPSTLVSLEDGIGVIVREGRVRRIDLEILAPEWFSADAVEIPVEESR